ncbi:MAG: twin-arginine translocation pathway signal protein [Rhodobacteraceae bacterium]|nr:twin-arginine translocation pathway signal protein [Paracoccaceae bacterium]
MGSKEQDQPTSRRSFLKMASVSAPAAVATLAATTGTAEASAEDRKTEGVQDTAHTRAYFDSARF